MSPRKLPVQSSCQFDVTSCFNDFQNGAQCWMLKIENFSCIFGAVYLYLSVLIFSFLWTPSFWFCVKQNFEQIVKQLFEIFLTISKNCQPNVLSTRVSKTECYKHTFSENFGLCFKFVLISIIFFTKLSGVQSTNDGGLLGRVIVALTTT